LQQQTNSSTKIISKTVWTLSLVSLFTDMASEMLYPIMPIFLKQIGFGIILIGFLEGFAEAVAGLTKPYFGKLSDSLGKRIPFVKMGYSLSAISKPMMAFFVFPLWILLVRAIDRLGKGIRTGARDALLSEECTPETKGRVFGFHRSMDTIGAVLGPSLALLYLYFYPGNYTNIFLIATCPGLLAIGCTFFLKEKQKSSIALPNKKNKSIFSFFSYWKTAPVLYKKLVFGLLLFAVFNSSDIFLMLKMKESGASDFFIIAVYIFYNLVYVLMAYPLGILADKWGFKKMLMAGFFVYSIVYAGFALTNSTSVYLLLFGLYGIYAAATEGISKAWISNIVSTTETGTAIGTFSGLQSIAALIASSLCGIIWANFGASFAFFTAAAIAFVLIIYLFFLQTIVEKDVVN
jgi:MFS family permease